MATTTVNLKPLEEWAKKLIAQQKDVAIENAANYAQQKVVRAFETSEYQRRTGNLDDSFLWIVCYDGEIKKHGFLFDSQQATQPIERNGKTYNGRVEAEKFVATYQSKVTKGIEIVFASAMFYAGFLEVGVRDYVYQVLRGIEDDLLNDGFDEVKTNIFPVQI